MMPLIVETSHVSKVDGVISASHFFWAFRTCLKTRNGSARQLLNGFAKSKLGPLAGKISRFWVLQWRRWGLNLIIFIAISWSILVFFGGSETYDL